MPDQPEPPISDPVQEARKALLARFGHVATCDMLRRGYLHGGRCNCIVATRADALIEAACAQAQQEERDRAAARMAELEALVRRALDLAARWRDVNDETFGRLTADGSADLDYMHDERDDIEAALAAALREVKP